VEAYQRTLKYKLMLNLGILYFCKYASLGL